MGLMASCVFVFYILEFFDEDITAILHALFTLRTGSRNYYA
ncbi:virB3 type IV secretion protein [Helicobacter pylori Hp H-45]|uniref:VirB3 type IV secretion protein n=2 Tax=Helicobacter pylori TaxID=210 RepID=J0LXX6_HELPX|nr:virB3 type IV secretion protein [Helicobacter pylori Hp H-45]